VSAPSGFLGADRPVFVAPMAGGPTTPALVTAAAAAGSFGFLAAGYRTADDLAAQIATTRAETDHFGVNLFVPNSVAIDPTTYREYRERLLPLAEHYAVELPVEPRADDDHWRDKLEVVLASPPPVVSFTFGIPDATTISSLHRAGIVLAQTVTSPDEAVMAAESGMDAVVVQAPAAGGHSGTFTPHRPLADVALPQLVAQVAARMSLPIIAGGGVSQPVDVNAALHAGAVAVSVGTALLLADEAGTSAAHRQALLEWRDRPTTITRAFTGRPARGITNTFIETHLDAPFGYPALHHLTSPIRRAAAGDLENVHVWAGAGCGRTATRPAAEILRELSDR